MQELTWDDVRAAVRGGSVYASGGGGWVDHGLDIGRRAIELGVPKLVSVEELNPDDIVITCSAIGAPASKDWQMLAEDYIKSVALLQEHFEGKVVGTITPQNGCSSSINGWVQSAALGTLVVDAVGDMRAHPTGKMGSLGLAGQSDYQTIQVAVGGRRESGKYLEVVARGTVAATANILRTTSVESGSFITCARHPVTAAFVQKTAALGGISQAMRLGRAMLEAEGKGTEAVIQAIGATARAEVVGRGRVKVNQFVTQGAFDLGYCLVECGRQTLKLHIMNEWMAVDDQNGSRLTTFPDVICVLDGRSGQPLNVFQVLQDMEVIVISVHKRHLQLTAGVLDPTVYPEVEAALGISIADYALSP
jgi:DUF917 family protein